MSLSMECAKTTNFEKTCNFKEKELESTIKKPTESLNNGFINDVKMENGIKDESNGVAGVEMKESTNGPTIKSEKVEDVENNKTHANKEVESTQNNDSELSKSCESVKNELTSDNVKSEAEKNPPLTNGNHKNSENSFSNNITNESEKSKENRISEQLNKVELIKEELCNEEATLYLLKKIIESQRGKNSYKHSKSTTVPSLHPKKPGHMMNSKSNSLPVSGKSPGASQKYYIQVGNQLVPAPTPSSNHHPYTNGNSSYQPPQKPQPPPPPKITAEQKQTAAKAALRRQLEQTLLQIPPPRPPPADWKAIPNVNSIDFMMLVGLDQVVDSILELDTKPTLTQALEGLMPFNPRVCSQCAVDFSPCWKTSDDKENFVLCEKCAFTNIKKDLKAEHTSRLKEAFLKALTQEQEIEAKIKAGEEVNIPNMEKTERINQPSPTHARLSSPKTHSYSSQSPTEPRGGSGHHQSSREHHRPHKVVSHYPQHTSLVQQLHHQHIQQQQHDMRDDQPSNPRSQQRWRPYIPSASQHHQRSTTGSSAYDKHQEYYVVHHPQHRYR